MNRELKNIVLLVGIVTVVLFLTQLVFAQEQPSAGVVELESEVNMDQLKPSQPMKNALKKMKTESNAKKIEPKSLPKTTSVQDPIPETEAETIKPRAKYDEPAAKTEDRNVKNAKDDKNKAQGPDNPEESVTVEPIKPENMISDTQVIQLSESLRKLIEENDGLKKEINDLDIQLKNVKGQRALDGKRMNEVTIERDALRKQTENIATSNNKYEADMSTLKQQMSDKEQEYLKRIHTLEEEVRKSLEEAKAAPVSQEPNLSNSNPPQGTIVPVANSVAKPNRSITVDLAPNYLETQKRTKDLSDNYQNLLEQKKKIAQDEAKIHYNMGNTFYGQGDYFNAVKEYRAAVKLAPEDASTHYNLAFVSSEFLHDYKTAVKHYKQYLFLSPGAKDADVVRQKIINCEVELKGEVNFESDMNKTLIKLKNEAHEME